MEIDIHQFARGYDRALANLDRQTISERNKQLIRGYCQACLLRQVCGKVRLASAITTLTKFARLLEKDFDQVTRADLERVIGQLMQHQPAYSVLTISVHQKLLRRFLLYVSAPDQFPTLKTFPEAIAWMKGHVRRRDRPTLQRSDLVTPTEIDLLLRTTNYVRDRAFISALWEAGPRVSEIGNMHIKDAVPVTNGYTLNITGKTGTRNPLVITSAPHLSAWLSVHPDAGNPNAPLWPQLRSRQPLSYDAICRLLQRLFHKAGIKKPCHPHLFRHSRVTYVLANAIMNEQQAKTYFGWTPESDVIGSTYAHLTDSDANNAILRENNLAPHQQAQRDLQPITCRICHQLNTPRAEYCQRCHAVLDLHRAYEHQQLHDLKEELFTQMFKVMVEKGLVDEAAGAIHAAGLGKTLKRLALHLKGEQRIGVKQDTPPPETNHAV